MHPQTPDTRRSEERQAELLTVAAAAHRAGVSRHIVGSWISRGQLPTVRIDGRRHVRAEDLAKTQALAHVGNVLPAWRRNPQRAGKRLRALREAVGLNQQELAAACGLTHEAISRLETGTNAPYAETVRQLAHALDVAPVRFVARDTIAPKALTVAEAAARLEVPAARVQRWLRKGLLVGTKVSGVWHVPLEAIVDLERRERLRGRSRRLDPRYHG